MRQAPTSRWGSTPPEQLPWVLTGKWYLLVRLVYQIAVVGWWMLALRRGTANPSAWSLAGVAAIVVGFGIRRWARHVLGERFRSFEVRREERGLETSGPYAYVRHPGYVGLGLMDVGLPLVLDVPEAAFLSLVPLALIVRRARLEDDLLRQVYS